MPHTTTGAWQVHSTQDSRGVDALRWNPNYQLRDLGSTDVLVRFHAASLNYRDVAITYGTYPRIVEDNVIPGSDGAGEVVEAGSRVTRFKPGDRVLTFVCQDGFISSRVAGEEAKYLTLGSTYDGVFRQHGVFEQQGLVLMPETLSYEQGAAIPNATLTAWNALEEGLRPVRPGDCVLTQGTGGVSMAAIQFALTAGAMVIATTSSDSKAERLKKLGVHHVINYREDPEWGATAKRLSPQGRGCSHVVEVGGLGTMAQSIASVARGGEIASVGFLAGAETSDKPGPSMLEPLIGSFMIRGVEAGNRQQFQEMNLAIDVNKLVPILADRVFKLNELKAAYQYLEEGKHFGKVIVTMD